MRAFFFTFFQFTLLFAPWLLGFVYDFHQQLVPGFSFGDLLNHIQRRLDDMWDVFECTLDAI